MSFSDEDINRWVGQAQNDQTDAGLKHIARTVADFRDYLTEYGFTRSQAFKMSRDLLIELMAKVGPAEDDE